MNIKVNQNVLSFGTNAVFVRVVIIGKSDPEADIFV